MNRVIEWLKDRKWNSLKCEEARLEERVRILKLVVDQNDTMPMAYLDEYGVLCGDLKATRMRLHLMGET